MRTVCCMVNWSLESALLASRRWYSRIVFLHCSFQHNVWHRNVVTLWQTQTRWRTSVVGLSHVSCRNYEHLSLFTISNKMVLALENHCKGTETPSLGWGNRVSTAPGNTGNLLEFLIPPETFKLMERQERSPVIKILLQSSCLEGSEYDYLYFLWWLHLLGKQDHWSQG